MGVGLKNILLLNCDSNTSKALTDYLGEEPESFHLLTAVADEHTLEILNHENVFLLILFIENCLDFPHPLFKKVIAGYPQLKIILVLPPDNNRIRNAIPPHANLHIIEKPCEPLSIGHLVTELASQKQTQGFTGTLKIVRLDDLIQMCCLSGATITIQVDNEAQQGQIFIKEGEILHAQCGETVGEDAFYAIMSWDNGEFKTLEGVPEKDTTIKGNYQYLLLEAARRSDELNKMIEDNDAPVIDADIVTVNKNKLQVLMVEDSTLMAKIMSTMLLVAGDIEIAGIAHNGQEALEIMELLQFDVILLDVNMPVMNGNLTIKHIMVKSPCPVVIMSNVSSRAPETVISMLDLGAVDFVSKPTRGRDFSLQQKKIVKRIRQAASADSSIFRRYRSPREIYPAQQKICSSSPAKRLVIISSGCSGHGALYQLIARIPETNRSAFISLNSIPLTFLTSMSAHLSHLCHKRVTPLNDGMPLHKGEFYVDSQRHSLLLQEKNNSIQVRSLQEEQGIEYGPSYFDLFLFSAADVFQDRLIVILLSGAEIGNLEGLRYIRENGGSIFGQERSTCIMPDFLTPIIQENLIDEELRPEAIADRITSWTNDRNVYDDN